MILHKIKRDSKSNRVTKGGTVRETTDLGGDDRSEPKKKSKKGFVGTVVGWFTPDKKLKEEEEKKQHAAHSTAQQVLEESKQPRKEKQLSRRPSELDENQMEFIEKMTAQGAAGLLDPGFSDSKVMPSEESERIKTMLGAG